MRQLCSLTHATESESGGGGGGKERRENGEVKKNKKKSRDVAEPLGIIIRPGNVNVAYFTQSKLLISPDPDSLTCECRVGSKGRGVREGRPRQTLGPELQLFINLETT